MKKFDVIVIGGGILGCFAARNLRRWNISVCLLEKEPDVCTGITKANSAVPKNWRKKTKLEFIAQLRQKLPPGGKLAKIFDF